jgi:hypothetical protein
LQLHRRAARLPAGLCAVLVSIGLAGACPAAGTAQGALPVACGARPSWIAAAALQDEAHGPLPSCFSAGSGQTEAVLSIADNRPYAQMITVAGGAVDLAESSFGDRLDASMSTLLAKLSPAAGPSAFLIGPGQRATLAIDRPAPGSARQVLIVPAHANAFAVAAVVWRFLSAAAARGLLTAGPRTCVASVLHAALQQPPRPERALRRVHACVDAAHLPARAETRLRGLASRLLRDDVFQSVVYREGTEPRRARFVLSIPASNPELINPDIRLGAMSIGTVPGGSRTVEHLTASGGVPPYRFYAVAEPGGPGVPAWLRLAADGTLVLEPPAEETSVTLAVEVVDSTGQHSVVPY